MRNGNRVLVGLLALVGLMILAGCTGAPGCPQAGFGNSTPCTAGSAGNIGGSGGSGGGGGGGGSSSVTAYAYAVDSANSTIDGYALNAAKGTFAAISNYTAPTTPANGGGMGMAIAQETYLYVGFASVGEIYSYSINSSGQLTLLTTYLASELAGFPNGPGQSIMITNPDGTLLFLADGIDGSIYVWSIGNGQNGTTAGALTAVSGSPFQVPTTSPAFTPLNLATDGAGAYLYAVDGNNVDHQGAGIAAWSIGTGSNGTTLGALTPVTGSPFLTSGSTNFSMWQLQGEPTGQFMIGTTGSSAFYTGVSDNDNLYVFSIAQSTSTTPGALTPVTGSPFATTYSPFTIAAQPTGNQVYSFSFADSGASLNPIEGYEIGTTGALTVDAESPFSLPNDEGTWGQFDQTGGYLFVYESYTNTSNQVVTYIAPLVVGSGGTLTQVATPVDLSAPGFWVVTDPN